MNKKELIVELSERTGIRRQEVGRVLNALFALVIESMKKNVRVKLKGFGVFFPIFQDSRPVRNPRTGEACDMVPRNNFRFRPGDDVGRELNKQ